MGILYLSGVLEENIDNCNIKILDLAKCVRSYSKNKKRKNIDIDDIFLQEISSQKWNKFTPEFIGISILFSTAHKTSGHIADSLQQLWPNSPIIVGGIHATSAVESLLEIPSVVYVCRGEAGSIVVQVAKSAKSNDDLEKIPGIISVKNWSKAKRIERQLGIYERLQPNFQRNFLLKLVNLNLKKEQSVLSGSQNSPLAMTAFYFRQFPAINYFGYQFLHIKNLICLSLLHFLCLNPQASNHVPCIYH